MKIKLSKYFSSKAVLVMLLATTLAIVSCGDPVPVESMTDARYAISKAESVNAAKYSKENLEQAQAKLIESHTYASEKKMKDAKTQADEAKRLAELAFDESIPLLAQDTAAETEKLIKEAETLNAEEFASDEYSQALSLYDEGKQAEESSDYLTAQQKYELAREEARKARDISEAKVEYMKRDAAEIQQMLSQAERYGAKTNFSAEYNSAASEISKAKNEINNRELKNASTTLETARTKAQALLDKSQKSWASDRYVQAENELGKAEKDFQDLQSRLDEPDFKKLYNDSASAQSAMKNAENTLAAAKQAKDSASNYLTDGQYTQSYNQSSESIRLSKIVSDQATQVEGIVVNSKKSTPVTTVPVATATTEEPRDGDDSGSTTTDSSTEQGTTEEPKTTKKGWKTYTVRLIPGRRDCLWRIAGYDFIYGNSRLWSRIYKANKSQIANPDLIYPGQIFNIPPKEGAIEEPPVVDEEPSSYEENEEVNSEETGGGVIGGGH